MITQHLTPSYIAEYMAKLKWIEENPVNVSVSEFLYATKSERKELKKHQDVIDCVIIANMVIIAQN